jgi:hypothetical protein
MNPCHHLAARDNAAANTRTQRDQNRVDGHRLASPDPLLAQRLCGAFRVVFEKTPDAQQLFSPN